MSSTTMLYVQPQGHGWGPVNTMVRLAARLLEADLMVVPDTPLGQAAKLRLLLPRIRGRDTLLVVAAVPEHLNAVLCVPGLRHRFGTVAGWVIDCWWTDRVPVAVTRGRLYDRLLVTEKGVVSHWQQASGLPVTWLPLGTDALAAWRRRVVKDGSGPRGADPVGVPADGPWDGGRPVDLQRMGRQAPAWDDDAALARCAADHGLVMGARPPFGATAAASYRNVLDSYRRAKVVLAFTNLVSPAEYTHPTREYVTSRWLDALAGGALVAGRRPREEGSDELLWEGATVDLPVDDLEAGMAQLALRLADWSPREALALQVEALRRLDWRLRLRVLATELGLECPALARSEHHLAAARQEAERELAAADQEMERKVIAALERSERELIAVLQEAEPELDAEPERERESAAARQGAGPELAATQSEAEPDAEPEAGPESEEEQ